MWLNRRELLAALLVGPVVRSTGTTPPAADPLTSLSVVDVRRRIRDGTLSPVDLTNAYLSRIRGSNGDLGAFVTVATARALADARRTRRSLPLGGVPIAHKDLFETAGIRTAAGSLLFQRHVPTEDAAVVAAFARAGAVLLGKTNTHELGGGVTTINPFFGTTRNPANPLRIAGGSSGGSAAAVAADLAAAATGSDTGGSVRIPAALCGCVGFKPSFGRLSTAGLLGACPTFDHVGLLTRTADDALLVFQAILGPPRAAPRRTRLRVGVARAFFFDGLQPDVSTAVARALDRWRAAGALVVDRDLPVDGGTMSRVFDPIVASEIWTRYGEDWRRRPEVFSRDFGAFFASRPPAARDVAEARRALSVFQGEVARAFDGIDVIVTPTVPVTAPPITGPIDAALILRNTWPFNAARTPAVTVPCGTDEAGLPIGLQIAGPIDADDVVLNAARAFADTRPDGRT